MMFFPKILVLFGLVGICMNVTAADNRWEWRQTDDALALMNSGSMVWQFHRGILGGKSYFHPISLADGTVLTELRPKDHPHHLALWFSWKYLNGLNYWEENNTTRLSEGLTDVVEARYTPQPDFSAVIEQKLEYHPPQKPTLLFETRRMEISCPDTDGNYRIDWFSRFTAGKEEVKMDRTPILGEKNGVSHGGYAGLSVRFSDQLSEAKVMDSDGSPQMNLGAHRLSKRARWVDYTLALPRGKSAGIGIIDHSKNPRYPTPWYVIVDSEQPFYYYSPALLHDEPMTLAANQSFDLRYRIFVHSGRTDPAVMEKECKNFEEKAK